MGVKHVRILCRSEQFELFPEIFLNLSFVESMMKATSSVDLLNDYKRYGPFIIAGVSFFRKIGRYRPLLVYFCPFLIAISRIEIEKSVDGVLWI